ncbi:MAG: D-glycero-beta-D-manno-heptose 1,7-bisphosphate 7-phosphatase [Gammaproteobacteria bacterium]
MKNLKPKLIVVDRDGVINYESEKYIKSPEEWIPIEGSLEALVRLKQAGYLLALATNQAGVARGLYGEKALKQIHEKMHQMLGKLMPNFAFDCIEICMHHPDENCNCRKPRPGMLLNISKNLKIENSPENIWFVGDSERDFEAAEAANCLPILVQTGNGWKAEKNLKSKTKNLLVFDNLLKVADYLC